VVESKKGAVDAAPFRSGQLVALPPLERRFRGVRAAVVRRVLVRRVLVAPVLVVRLRVDVPAARVLRRRVLVPAAPSARWTRR
jgi:hypothetical protein